jgi:putative colanic acid biosynthesis UDP-glucose lipid carrier transferase
MTSGEMPLISFLKRLMDPLVIVGSLVAITLLFDVEFSGLYLVLAVITFFISSQVFDELDPFHSWKKGHFGAHGRDILIGWLIVVGILLFLGYATKLSSDYSRRVLLTWIIVVPIALFTAHVLARAYVARMRSEGNVRTVVIAGANELGARLARRIKEDPYLFMDVKGFFDDRTADRIQMEGEGALLGQVSDLPEYVRNNRISIIYVALPMAVQPRIMKLLEDLGNTTASIYFVPDIFLFDLVQARFDDVRGIPVIAICETPFTGVNSVVKRLSDVVLATLILLLLTPLMLAIAMGVKLTSPGPVIFKQRRYGLEGEEITVYKFRSMTVCEDGTDVPQATKCDMRITPFGAFLRRSSLDELPQFINVLQGRMSIVGPRPHAVAHNEMYRKLISGYMIRHKVKPGITGWAQVNGLRGETETLDKMKARVEYDIEYLRDWSLFLDLWIIARTVLVVFRDRNAY